MQAMKPNTSEEMSSRVVEALATVTDSDPVSMTPPLYEVVDPDALNRLLETDASVELRFEYGDHMVVADSDGTVSVDGVLFRADSPQSPTAVGQQVHKQD